MEFMMNREDDSGGIRLLIWRGLVTTVLYTWRKYSYFRDPIWLYLTKQIDQVDLVQKIMGGNCCWESGLSGKVLENLLPCDLPRRMQKLQSSATGLDVSRLALGEILAWANVEIEGGFAELLIVALLFRNVVFTCPVFLGMYYRVTEFLTASLFWLFVRNYTFRLIIRQFIKDVQ